MTTRSDAAGRVAALFRYPVKSMLGQACATIEPIEWPPTTACRMCIAAKKARTSAAICSML